MSKGKKDGKEKKDKTKEQPEQASADLGEAAAEAPEPKEPMSAKEFEKEMEKLQVEVVKMQEWVVATGAKVCVLFEGRDTAGKGGVIKRITERTSPRVLPPHRLARANRTAEIADVFPTVHALSARSRRSHALRLQLVQPVRRRAGDGLCH